MIFYCATKLTAEHALSDKEFAVVDNPKRSFIIGFWLKTDYSSMNRERMLI